MPASLRDCWISCTRDRAGRDFPEVGQYFAVACPSPLPDGCHPGANILFRTVERGAAVIDQCRKPQRLGISDLKQTANFIRWECRSLEARR